MAQDAAPEGWRQRIRRGIPFPPGCDDERFEAIVTRDDETYALNLSTGEVYVQTGEHTWDQPQWIELPDVVRERARSALSDISIAR